LSQCRGAKRELGELNRKRKTKRDGKKEREEEGKRR
jgi:hypothetical protein